MLRNVLANPPDAISIIPDDSAALQKPLEEALKAGVKHIIIMDTVTEDVEVFTSSIVSDDNDAGKRAALALNDATGGEGAVLASVRAPGSPPLSGGCRLRRGRRRDQPEGSRRRVPPG